MIWKGVIAVTSGATSSRWRQSYLQYWQGGGDASSTFIHWQRSQLAEQNNKDALTAVLLWLHHFKVKTTCLNIKEKSIIYFKHALLHLESTFSWSEDKMCLGFKHKHHSFPPWRFVKSSSQPFLSHHWLPQQQQRRWSAPMLCFYSTSTLKRKELSSEALIAPPGPETDDCSNADHLVGFTNTNSYTECVYYRHLTNKLFNHFRPRHNVFHFTVFNFLLTDV